MNDNEDLQEWLAKIQNVLDDAWKSDMPLQKRDEDICPRCGDDKLRGYEDHHLVVCWTCEWSINKTAWLEAWK